MASYVISQLQQCKFCFNYVTSYFVCFVNLPGAWFRVSLTLELSSVQGIKFRCFALFILTNSAQTTKFN
jgi:hypothetical protein